MSSKKKRYTNKKQNINPRSKWMGFLLIAFGLLIISLGVYTINYSFASPIEIESANTQGILSLEEAYKEYQADAYFLDIRSEEEWEAYHIPNTNLIPLNVLPQHLEEIPQDEIVIIVCRSGNRSQQGRDYLIESGYTNVFSMAGGLESWMEMGFPIKEGNN
jgi:rhodanese-related sulfurtransferase